MLVWQPEIEGEKEREWEGWDKDRETERHTDIQTHRHTDRLTDKQR
jgi:hypothetical protein